MEEKVYGIIYRALNKVNGKLYIGQTKHSLEFRKIGHENSSKNNDGFYFQRAITKYGKDNFSWLIIDTATSKEELDYLEQFYIDFFCSVIKETGYNLAMGCQFGDMNAETRQKMSINKRAFWDSAESSFAKKSLGVRVKNRSSNSIWVHNNAEEKFILKNELDKFISAGYTKGRQSDIFSKNRKGKIYICKRLSNEKYETKLLTPEEAKCFLNNGWERGCGFNKNPNNETRIKLSIAKMGKSKKHKAKGYAYI